MHGGRTIITLARAGARCEFGEFRPGRVGIITSQSTSNRRRRRRDDAAARAAL
jgi:hypothetical protein